MFTITTVMQSILNFRKQGQDRGHSGGFFFIYASLNLHSAFGEAIVHEKIGDM